MAEGGSVTARGDQIQRELRGLQAEVSEYRGRFDRLKGDAELTTKASATEFQRALRDLQAKNEATSSSILSELSEARDRVRELVDQITTGATGGAFGVEADRQKASADRWRIAAVLLGLLASAVAVWALTQTGSDSGVAEAIAKGFGTLAVYGLAGYAGAQSASHRAREERARRLQLELAAFEPFVSRMDEPKKQAAREAYATRLFVGAAGPESDRALDPETLSTLQQAVGVLRQDK